MSTRVGLISDTHGLLRPEALEALAGSDLILHAGDIGGTEVLERLAELAPVTTVRGNVDEPGHLRLARHSSLAPDWAADLPTAVDLEVEGVRVHLIHDLARLAAGVEADVIVAGHSHIPKIEHRGNMLVVNPGSAGPRRFKLPISLGRLHIDGGDFRAELVTLGY